MKPKFCDTLECRVDPDRIESVEFRERHTFHLKPFQLTVVMYSGQVHKRQYFSLGDGHDALHSLLDFAGIDG